MRIMSKKLASILLASLVSSSIFIGCSKPAAPANTTQPTGNTPAAPLEVSIWTWLGSVESWGGKSYNEVLAYQQLPSKTNSKINWVHPTGDAVEAFNLMMTSGETTDLIWYPWTPVRAYQYSKSGRIIDIMPYVKKSAPNLMKLIEANPQLKKQLIDPQGRMFYMPWITLDKSLKMGEGMMIRKDWLDKVGMSVPKTNEELYQVFKAFRDKDANGNGKQDEIGITGYPGQIYKLFYGFNVADDWMLKDGKATYGPSTPEYKEALKWFNKLYKEGLLDKDYLTNDGDIYDKKNLSNQIGAYIDNYGVFSTLMKNSKDQGSPINYTPVPYMQVNGVSVNLGSATKRVAQPYGLAISAKAKDPEALVKFLDYNYSKEGQLLFNWGVEGNSYTMKDGLPVWTDKVTKDPKDAPLTALTKYANPAWVGLQDPRTEQTLLDELGQQTRKTWASADNSNAFEPLLWMTDDESAKLKQYTTDLATFKNEWRDKFITGQESIDAKFDWYVDQLKKMGVEEAAKVQQSAYERFIK